MTRVENVLVDAFRERTSMAKAALLDIATEQESPPLLREGLFSLTAKGVLLEDDWGIITLNRDRARQVREQVQLYEPLYGEE